METRPDGSAIGGPVTGPGQRTSSTRSAGRDNPRARDANAGGARSAMSDAILAMMESCERYATAYSTLHRAPIGCDAALGPILLEVLQGVAALACDDDLADRVSEIISTHALDLEE